MLVSRKWMATTIAVLLIVSGCALAWHPSIAPTGTHPAFPEEIPQGRQYKCQDDNTKPENIIVQEIGDRNRIRVLAAREWHDKIDP